MLTVEDIQLALSTVQEPERKADIVSLKMVKKIQVDEGDVTLVVELPVPMYHPKDALEASIKKTIRALPGAKDVSVIFTTQIKPERTAVSEPIKIPGVKHVIAVYACKGGVGKSTIATNLSAALVRRGFQVGLLDADIHGPNVPLMMGLSDQPSLTEDNKLKPLVGHGVKVMSLGVLRDVTVPLIWRGPMVHGAVQQLLRDTDWGALDYLVIDLPPGTGDAQLTIIQSVPLSGVVFVTTPQTVSLLDGVKGIVMFQKLEVPILGLVENMSGFTCPHCQKTTNIFSSGGGEEEAQKRSIPFLGLVPIDPAVVVGGDTGRPIVVSHPDSHSSRALFKMTDQVVAFLEKNDSFDSNLSFSHREGLHE